MSYDDDDFESDDNESQNKKFFGLEVSDGVTYVIVLILTVIFIRQV